MPEQHAPKLLTPEILAATFSFEDSFHRADWQLMYDWIDARIDPAHKEAAWDEAAVQWVTRLRNDVGGDYCVLQSQSTIVLCEPSADRADWVLAYADRSDARVREFLGDIAWKGMFGRSVLLVFSDVDDYDHYVSHYCPDGEQAASVGMCIHSGYTHVALAWYDQITSANTIIHELAHASLASFPIPRWLNEGIALSLERLAAVGWREPVISAEIADRHFDYWTEEKMQAFWAGTSFAEPGDAHELSYSLTEILISLLSERTQRKAFQAFVESAKWQDAGQTAATHILDIDLGELAGTFLGPGNWRPSKKTMEALWGNSPNG